MTDNKEQDLTEAEQKERAKRFVVTEVTKDKDGVIKVF